MSEGGSTVSSQEVDELEIEQYTKSEEEEIQQKRDEAEEAFDPEKPEELATEAEIAAEEEEEEEEGGEVVGTGSQSEDSREDQEEDDSNDSIVVGDDEVEYSVDNHSKFIELAKKMDADLLCKDGVKARTASGKERCGALCEALMDHYLLE